jgi:hypothetical protein
VKDDSLYPHVDSVIALIRGAVSRAKHNLSESESESPTIGSIGELIDKYHKHQTTMRHDKVYAQLGMASDAGA